MSNPQIVDSAQRKPGGDLLTGESTGPFLDTGIDIGSGRGSYGNRIYLSIRHLEPLVDQLGWLSKDKADTLKAEVEYLKERNAHLEAVEDQYHSLIHLVSPHIPPRVVEKEVIREVPRDMTEDEVRVYVRKHGAELLREQHKTRDEQYRATYTGHGYLSGDRTLRKKAKPAEIAPEELSIEGSSEGSETKQYEPATYPLHGQTIVLDDLLKMATKKVLEVVEGNDEEFVEAVVIREYELADIKGNPHPRKGLIEALGYEFEETS